MEDTMNLEELFAQIRALPDADFHRLSDEMYVISREREARDQVEAAQAELVVELQEAHPELAPKYAPARAALGRLLVEEGDLDGALVELRELSLIHI